ncbi:family 16 glycosylhydrolase [Cereibacter sp. SYSU M97828]|nr:family 16 glycosylhydrolase [Cereibacter flavus]
MNLNRPSMAALRLAFRLGYGLRRLLPAQKSTIFGQRNSSGPTIDRIYVINLDRAPDRWSRIKSELRRLKDNFGIDLLTMTERHRAVDARSLPLKSPHNNDIDPFYTLADQLFVEPQPLTLPTRFELEAPIQMSKAEIAVAMSHIEVWRRIAQGTEAHALVLEDDVWFHPSFGRYIDEAWKEIANQSRGDEIDVVYVSYLEAKHGAPKHLLSRHVFAPERGLWYLSGYILSRQGAKKLLELLPCRGPIDLWINYQFSKLNVFATRRAIVLQRKDSFSTNSYSILPSLSKIGAINSEGAALFHAHPPQLPVFAFGPANSGQSCLAMALSMLGYRCCSDLAQLPSYELTRLREGRPDRVFGAYVNVGQLEEMVEELRQRFPDAKFVVTTPPDDKANDIVQNLMTRLAGADVIALDTSDRSAWRVLCEHLRCVPPLCPFPTMVELGQRPVMEATNSQLANTRKHVALNWDRSPWVVESDHGDWKGVRTSSRTLEGGVRSDPSDSVQHLEPSHWETRSDTFTGNLALFRPSNVELQGLDRAKLYIRHEDLGVRQYSAGALTSPHDYLFGRFEATFRASDVPGVITGFFLHRNSPHQEIDIEILGRNPEQLLINVFYNPGGPGDKFDFGYRGSPVQIDLGFDASKEMHRYAIEWSPSEIRWFVEDLLVHRRNIWNPTPIPNLPMKLHFNAWPSRAFRFAGRLNNRRLPAMAELNGVRTSTLEESVLEPGPQGDPCSDQPERSGVSA